MIGTRVLFKGRMKYRLHSHQGRANFEKFILQGHHFLFEAMLMFRQKLIRPNRMFLIKWYDPSVNAPKRELLSTYKPAHEITALFVLCKFILQKRMRSHTVGLDV